MAFFNNNAEKRFADQRTSSVNIEWMTHNAMNRMMMEMELQPSITRATYLSLMMTGELENWVKEGVILLLPSVSVNPVELVIETPLEYSDPYTNILRPVAATPDKSAEA